MGGEGRTRRPVQLELSLFSFATFEIEKLTVRFLLSRALQVHRIQPSPPRCLPWSP